MKKFLLPLLLAVSSWAQPILTPTPFSESVMTTSKTALEWRLALGVGSGNVIAYGSMMASNLNTTLIVTEDPSPFTNFNYSVSSNVTASIPAGTFQVTNPGIYYVSFHCLS